jgi:hypothetical protein
MGRRKKCEQIKRTNNVMVRFTDAEYASIPATRKVQDYPPAHISESVFSRKHQQALITSLRTHQKSIS